jgi:Transcriptional Coactivator p15 (PC4)
LFCCSIFAGKLSGKRRATVREFKGKKFLDIREYWEKDGKMLPGKKGEK